MQSRHYQAEEMYFDELVVFGDSLLDSGNISFDEGVDERIGLA